MFDGPHLGLGSGMLHMVPLHVFESLAQVQDAMVVVVGQMSGDRCGDWH